MADSKFARIVIIVLLCWMLPSLAEGQEFKAILSRLESENSAQQREAFLVLQKLKDHSSWPKLVPLLNSNSPKVRRYAVSILGEWGLPAARGYILAKLRDPDKWVRAATVWALARGDQKVTDDTVAALGDQDWQVRCVAVNVIGQLVKSGNPLWCNKLLPLLQDRHWQVRYAAVCQIGNLQCTQGLNHLQRILQNSQEIKKVRAAVCRSLAKIGDEQSLLLLLQVYRSDSAQVRLAADHALTQMAKSYLPWFMTKLQDRSTELILREYILTILGRVRAARAVPLLRKLVQDPNETTILRAGILSLLAQLQGAEARPLFYRYLTNRNAMLQRGAVVALGRLRDIRALPQLFLLLSSSDKALCESTLWAITQVERQEVIPIVLQKLSASKNTKLLRQLIRLVGTLQITEAAPHLIDLQQQPSLQNAVCWALEIIYPQLPPGNPQRQRIIELVTERKKLLEKE